MTTPKISKDPEAFHLDFFEKIHQKARPPQIRVKPRISELSDYIIGEVIGQGGFGHVKKAIHIPTGQAVAIKVCKTFGLTSKQIQVIEREVEVQKSLFHENIAQIFEVIKTKSTIYIVMEYCQNGQLFDRINSRGPLPEKEAATIFHQILSALLYLRQQKISHRDVKPENVLFHKNGKVKLIDFGFSCLNSENQFRKTVCGTPSYIAPQIIKQESYDPQLVDVWCLGVTLYAMLAAELPFDDGPKQKRKYNIVNFRYTRQPRFSSRVQKLIASIFVQAKARPRLKDLLWSDFCITYQGPQSQYIDLNTEKVKVEENVVQLLIEKGVDSEKIIENIQRGTLSKFRPLYYLNLQKMQRENPNLRLNSLCKQKKNSSRKLEPLSRTPSVKRKFKQSDEKVQNFLQMKLECPQTINKREKRVIKCSPIDPSKSRLRKQSIDSPRRLIDCIPAYRAQ